MSTALAARSNARSRLPRIGRVVTVSVVAAALALVTTALVVPESGSAQVRSTFRIGVFGGTFAPEGALPNAPILADEGGVVSYGDIGRLVSFGLGLEARPGAVPIFLRASAVAGLAREETGQWGCAPDADGNSVPCPSILILVPTDVSVTTLAGDVGLDLAMGGILVRPLVGVGWVRYGYEWDPGSSETFSLEPGDAVAHAVAARYGVGLGIPLGRVRLDVDYLRLASDSERGRPSRASTFTVGVSMPLR